MKPYRELPRGRERGAATLVTVMALFLVMGLLAAYGNRSLLFEQRMASSYYKTDLVMEVGESGMDWVQALLNAGNLDAACKPAAVGTRFRDAYLSAPAPASRFVEGAVKSTIADCQRDAGGNWTCRCPAAGTLGAQPELASANILQPSFQVQIQANMATPPRAGAIRVDTLACSVSSVTTCGTYQSAESNSVTSTLLGLVSAMRSPPATPLIVKGDLQLAAAGGASPGLHSADPRGAGTLLVAGGNCGECKPGGLLEQRSETLPGTPIDAAVITQDNWLANTADIYRNFLGMTAARYANHPALRVVPCNGDCAKPLQDAAAAGYQMLWVQGPLQINSVLTLGTPARPVMLIATSDVNIDQPIQLFGTLVAGRDLSWSNAGGASLITGMVLVGRDASLSGPVDIYYTQAMADYFRNVAGSFVRVPGAWKR